MNKTLLVKIKQVVFRIGFFADSFPLKVTTQESAMKSILEIQYIKNEYSEYFKLNF